MEQEGNKIRLFFDHVGSGLIAKDGELKGFAIAGDNQRFVWAEAQIDGDTVFVKSDDIENPVAVRYAWSNYISCNLFNREYLPASPFRTDNWPGITLK
jgi:sialate O-acetylesterase